MKLNEAEIVEFYNAGTKPHEIALKYGDPTETEPLVVDLLRSKGFKVPWNTIGNGNIITKINEFKERVERDKAKLGKEKYEKKLEIIEKAKKTAMLEGDWKEPRIKTAEDLVDVFNTDPKARLGAKLCWGNDVDVADLLGVIYDGRITRDDAMKRTQEPSLKAYLGKFKKPGGIIEIFRSAVELLPLDKNDIIKDIFSRRLIEYRRHKLGNKPGINKKTGINKKDEFLKDIEKLDLKRINDPEIKEIVTKIKPEEREKIKEAIEDCYQKVYSKTKELFSMHEKGISGLEKKVKNPLFGVNGNNCEKYCTDFLSFYQVEGVQTLIDNKRVLLSDEPGVGKTAQAIGEKIELENRLGRKVKTLVVCPTKEVRCLWQEKLDEYITPERRKKMKIVNVDDYEKDLEKINGADTVIVDYHAFAFKQSAPNNLRKKNLKRKLKEAGFKLIILDEVHNVKNYLSASKYDNIKDIADKAEYLALLSGTPAPTRLRDFYSVISLLKPERIGKDGKKYGYKNAKEVARIHATSPGVIGAILRTNELERKLSEIMSLPKIKEIPVYVEMSKEQREFYNSVFENEELAGPQKLQKLKQALLNPELLGENEIESCKFKAIEDIIEKKIAKNEKVVIYSPLFRTKVLKVLEEKYKHYGALRMDGTNAKEREGIRRKFQKNPENKILIVNNVAGEGITLTAANNLICLDDPYSFGDRRQMKGRLWRPGQSKPVNVYSIIVKDSIDEGVQTFLQQKQIAIDYVRKGVPLTPEQKIILGDKGVIDKWLSIHTDYLYTPEQMIHRMTGRMVGKPEEIVKKALNGGFGKSYAREYYKDWENSFSGNMSQIYGQIVKKLETKEKLEKKVDIASGAGMLSHITGEKGIFNIEMNKYHFESSYASNENNNIEASMTNIPLGNEQYDFALCSLGLHILPNTKKDPSREKALKEANRILKKGGYYMTVLPGVLVNNREKFESGLEKTGFKVIPELSGYIKSKDKKINAFGYIATAKKFGEPKENIYELLNLTTDLNEKPKIRHQRRRGTCTEFEFCDIYGNKTKGLDDSINNYLNKLQGGAK